MLERLSIKFDVTQFQPQEIFQHPGVGRVRWIASLQYIRRIFYPYTSIINKSKQLNTSPEKIALLSKQCCHGDKKK